MPRLKVFDIDPVDVDPDGICQIQTPVGAGPLTLNGALVAGGVYTSGNGGATQIAIITAADDNARTLTITGTDADKRAQVETFTGADLNITTTESTKYWLTITEISIDAATAGAFTIGTVDEISTNTFPLDHYNDVGALVQFDVTGTINVTAQATAMDLRSTIVDQNAMIWMDATDAGIVGETADAMGRVDAGATGVRFLVNSYSSGAEVQCYISETRGN